MGKWIKGLLGGLLALIVVAIIALAVIATTVDPNRFRPEIEQAVARHTHGTLSLRGDLGWSLFPTLGIRLGALDFRLPEDGDTPFARLESAVLGVRLLPLLRGTVATDQLAVDSLTLNLVVAGDGTGNWTRIAPSPSETPSAPAATPAPKRPPADRDVALTVDSLSLRNTTVQYRDRRSGQFVRLGPVQLQADHLNLAGKPVHLSVDGEVSGDPLHGKTVAFALDTALRYAAADSTLTLNDLAFRLANLRVNADLTLHTGETVTGEGTVDIPAFSLPELLQALGQTPPATRDPGALTHLALNATLTSPGLMLDPLRLTLDDTVLSGRAGLQDSAAAHWVLNLEGNALNLDRYRPPEPEAEAASPQPATSPQATASNNDELLPVDTLRGLRLDARLALDRLTAENLHLADVSTAVSAADGVVTLSYFDAALYEGNAHATATLDVTGDTPRVTVEKQLTGVQLRPLLTDWQAIDQFAGTAQIHLKARTRGNSVDAWLRQLDGPMDLTVTDGRLYRINLERETCRAIAYARKQSLTADWPDDTRLDTLTADIRFRDGVGRTRALNAGLRNLSLTGDGTLDLTRSHFDYHLGMTLRGDLSGTDPACEVNEAYRDVAWPLRCQGDFGGAEPNTHCGIDQERLGDLVESLARRAARQKLKEKAAEELGDFWKALQGGGESE